MDETARHENWKKSHDYPVCVCVCVYTSQGVIWTPSKMIGRLGKEIDDPTSVYYWAYKVTSTTYPKFVCISTACMPYVCGMLAMFYIIHLFLPVLLHLLTAFSEQHSCVLPGPNRWLYRGHGIHPQLQESRSHHRHRTG